ncbi:hypothetical protein JHL17_34125 [Azospirillum sp. YIM B02556]|uniref:YtxH domain-containing protein n=1 Tax=Azospirillum endophyticum TaxID=2800326 RepID=A0ABS1FG98_9PROT|nr:hypothetical protein [Azospirillum endophyticum]MBK1842445.1 hypothetical protein [Azospirillum endophyticum]
MSDPATKLLDERIKDALAKHGDGPQDPPMDDAWRTKVDGRLDGLEKSVEGLKGSLDGLKIAASVLVGMVALVGGMVYFTASSLSTRMDRVETKVDAIVPRITDEFRAMRAEQSAQTSAIANVITATKQQAPQVILVPAPQVQQPAATQP